MKLEGLIQRNSLTVDGAALFRGIHFDDQLLF